MPNSGVLVETTHYTSAFVWTTLNAVLGQHDPDELKQNLLSGVVDGLTLSADTNWWQSGKPAPRHIHVLWRLQSFVGTPRLTISATEMWLKRGDNRIMVYQTFSQVEQKILYILLALNRVYYFGFKWIDVVLERLEICPVDCSTRLQRIYHVAPTESAQQLAALVEETV